MCLITDEDPGLRIESFAVINLRGVSTNKTIIYFIAMQTYKELKLLLVCKQVVTICSQAVNKLCSHCLFPVVGTSLEQAVNNL